MIPEPAVSVAPVVPSEISETIGTLHNDIQKLKQELDQALQVWTTTLEAERVQFGELLKHKELAWTEQENQWARQSQAYEQRLEELKSDFEARLKHTEQNAAQALAQLDDDWQRDKLEWGSRDQWLAERRVLEEKVASLESVLAEKKAVPETTPPTAEVLQTLDHQISLLHNIVQQSSPPAADEPPLNLV